MAKKKSRKSSGRSNSSKGKRSSAQKRAASPSTSVKAPWAGLPEWGKHAVILVGLLAVCFAFFSAMIFGGKGTIEADVSRWKSTAQSVIDYREAEGEEPLWAVNTFAGMPAYMISYKLAVPGLEIVHRTLAKITWPAFQLFILMVGMYFLVFYLTESKWAGLASALAIGLTTSMPILIMAGHNSKLVALSYAPYVMLGFAHALKKPGPLSALLFAIALSLNLRAGHVQITYYVAWLLAIWWIAEAVSYARKGEASSFFKSTGWLVVGGVGALLMVAQPYMSHAEFKDFTVRGAGPGGGSGGMGFDTAMGWSHGPIEFLTLLIADAVGGGQAYWGPKQMTEGPHYVGGAVIVLSVLALVLRRKAVTIAMGIGVLVLGVFAMGRHAEAINRLFFDVFPLFSSFRAPELWIHGVELALAVLAGLGLAALIERVDLAALAGRSRKATIVLGSMVLIVAAMNVGRDALFSFDDSEKISGLMSSQYGIPENDQRIVQTVNSIQSEQRPARVDRFKSDAARTLIVVVLVSLLVFGFMKGKIAAWMLAAGLIVVIGGDLYTVGQRYFDEDRLTEKTLDETVPEFGFDRYLKQAVEEAGGPGHFRVYSMEGNPNTAARPSYHYESLGGYNGAKLRVYQDYLDQILLAGGMQNPSRNALDLTNTRFVIAQDEFQGLTPVYVDQETGWRLYERTDALPRAYLVGQSRVVEESSATWSILNDPGFELGKTALLTQPLTETIVPIDSTSSASVELVSYGPREIVWKVTSDGTRLLVASETWYPAGWKAFVNGTEQPIRQANYLNRATLVPAGDSEVVMRFEPTTHRLSSLISGISTGLIYGLTLLMLGLQFWRKPTVLATEE